MASSTTEPLWGCETRYWCTTEGAVPATLSTAASLPGSSVVSDGDACGAVTWHARNAVVAERTTSSAS